MPTCRRSKHGARWKHANSHEIEAWHKVEARQLAWCHRPCVSVPRRPCTPTHHPTSHLALEKGKGEVRYRRREREGRVGDERVHGRKKVMELTGRGVQIGLEKTKIHWIEILGPRDVTGDTYFDVSLILSKGRHSLLMPISVYPFPSSGMRTNMRARLTLLDRRHPFKNSYISHLNFLHSVVLCYLFITCILVTVHVFTSLCLYFHCRINIL
jgi:hypothetical protein